MKSRGESASDVVAIKTLKGNLTLRTAIDYMANKKDNHL